MLEPMEPVETCRIFLALWPTGETLVNLGRARDEWAWGAGATPEPNAMLHLTLHYLGGVSRNRLPEFLDGLIVPSPCFKLRLDRSECWSNGVAVLTPKSIPPGLVELHEALRNQIERLGLTTDLRPYRPHVTLARTAGSSGAPQLTAPVQWCVSGYALVKSLAIPRRYVVLRHFG